MNFYREEVGRCGAGLGMGKTNQPEEGLVVNRRQWL